MRKFALCLVSVSIGAAVTLFRGPEAFAYEGGQTRPHSHGSVLGQGGTQLSPSLINVTSTQAIAGIVRIDFEMPGADKGRPRIFLRDPVSTARDWFLGTTSLGPQIRMNNWPQIEFVIGGSGAGYSALAVRSADGGVGSHVDIRNGPDTEGLEIGYENFTFAGIRTTFNPFIIDSASSTIWFGNRGQFIGANTTVGELDTPTGGLGQDFMRFGINQSHGDATRPAMWEEWDVTGSSGIWRLRGMTLGSVVSTTTIMTASAGTGNVIFIGTITAKGESLGVNAGTGNVGEFISDVADTTNPAASGAFISFATVTLTAGDWELSASCQWASGGTTAATIARCGISSSATGFDATNANNVWLVTTDAAAFAVNGTNQSSIGPRRVNITSTTTYYLVGRLDYSTLGGASWSANSMLQARRVR